MTPRLWIRYDSKLTVKANKIVRTGKITHPRKNESKKSGRSRVDSTLQSI